MSTAHAVKEAVKESLIGSQESAAALSAQTKQRFNQNAVKDPETGEYHIGPEQFVNAIAPPNEDYVSRSTFHSQSPWTKQFGVRLADHFFFSTAQDQAGTV